MTGLRDLVARRARRARQAAARDEGSAILEFIALSLLLLVPLVYLVLTLARVQAGAFAAESAANAAARSAVVEGVAEREDGASVSAAMAGADARASRAASLAASDFGFGEDDASLALTCEGACLEPGGNMDAEVTITVALPGIPGFVRAWIPLEVEVSGSARAPVDSVARDS